MQLEEFLEFLDENGVDFHTSHGSIIMKSCPSCGSEKSKVYFFKDRRDECGPFFGKCLKCEEKWNSRSYLKAYGIPREAINRLHGEIDPSQWNLTLAPAMPAIDVLGASQPQIEAPIAEKDISDFFPIPSWIEHPASAYAISRGWTKEHAHHIMMDYAANAVVFVVRDGTKVVGYQRRFLKPRDPDRKTLSSEGFLRRKFVMEFPNVGDVCVCEGPFTALAAWHYGFYAICTFGSQVGEEQLGKIEQLAKSLGRKVAVAFDLDMAGKKGYRRVSLSLRAGDVQTYRIRPIVPADSKPDGFDLNDAWQKGSGFAILAEDEDDLSIPDLSMPWEL